MKTRALLSLLPLLAAPLVAERPPCTPCPALGVDDPAVAIEALSREPPAGEALFLVSWPADLATDPAPPPSFAGSGATPWIEARFATPAPLLEHAAELAGELSRLARLVSAAGVDGWVSLDWRPREGERTAAELAYLVKRASVAALGARAGTQVLAGPLEAGGALIEALYREEVEAYLDGVAYAPAPPAALEAAALSLSAADPGAVAVVAGLPWPAVAGGVLAEAARYASVGVPVARFEPPPVVDAETLAPFRLLAAEFSGDLFPDPASVPTGAVEAWSFVRGEDLALRVVLSSPADADRVSLAFADPGLRSPALLDLAGGSKIDLWGYDRTPTSFTVEVANPPPVAVVALERMTAAELEGSLGLEEALTVEDARSIPVEEILRRLQAFEDGQTRRLDSYMANNTTHLRFQAGTGAQSVEVTFRGPFFFRQGVGFDWVWQEFLFNGVRWRGQTIPEIPLIQPERATALPIEISFTREYAYELRGTDTVDGRDCWVIDFRPAVEVTPGKSLFRGTVWVDRELGARVRTRAVQLGLEGEVISSEETTFFSAVDASGEPSEWAPGAFVLPLRVVGQQLWSVLNETLQVEREILLTEIEIDPENFDDRRQAALDSEATMVRETERGLRYLVHDEETGERVVQEIQDLNRRFLVGGVFYDESQDFPLPLAGMNWLWFDWRGKGIQANVFFAGVLTSIAVTDPTFLGSRWDAGLDVFALAVAGTDSVFRGDRELIEEDIEVLSPSIDWKLGHPLGNFGKLEFEYELEWRKFSRADDTAADFVIPSDHLQHSFESIVRFQRGGYRARAGGSYSLRSSWEPWGRPGNPDFDPSKDSFLRWSAAVGKTWHLPKFTKFGAELEYADGSRLDRFSKYGFGFFSNLRVHGYRSEKVRAEEAVAAHMTYGFDVASIVRLELVGDLAWATDRASGLDRETLAGVGLVGTLVGPWKTVINLDLGVAVDGPDDGASAFVTVLKLFNR